jgi:hypothetical protein
MAIDLKNGFYDLKSHIGHRVVVVGYGDSCSIPVNVAIECETCGEVLVDIEQPFYDENGICLECECETAEDEDGNLYCINEGCEHSIV